MARGRGQSDQLQLHRASRREHTVHADRVQSIEPPEQAAEQYKKGIAKDSQNMACRTNYGLMEARHGRIAEAIRIWQPVFTEAEIHYNLAGVYELDGRKLQAKTEYDKALELDPNFADAKSRLASLE